MPGAPIGTMSLPMDRCPLCAGDVVYVGLTRVECASVGCPNHRPGAAPSAVAPAARAPEEAPAQAPALVAQGADPDDDELELWLSSFVFF